MLYYLKTTYQIHITSNEGKVMKINLGVIFGGRSVEHEVSIISAIQAVNALDKAKYSIVPIYITKEGTWHTGEVLLEIENYKDINKLLSKCKKILISINSDENIILNYSSSIFRKGIIDRIDVAFPIIHGTHGEDGSLQGLFEIMKIPYVGCDVLSSAIGMNKIVTKKMLKSANLPIVDYIWFYSKEWLKDRESVIGRIEKELKYPVIVKPAALGSSIGVTKANNRNELEDAFDIARNFCNQLLVEEMISNLKEINCSVLGDYENVEVSVCEEPISSSDILSFQDKYLGSKNSKGMSGALRKIPADIPQSMSDLIQDMAKQTFLLLNCHGVVRVDFLIDKGINKIFVNEINTIPGSLSFYLWEASGKSFTDLTTKLIELALKRKREKDNLIFSYDANILADYKGVKGLKNIKQQRKAINRG